MKESSMEEMVVETVEMTAPLAEESLVTGVAEDVVRWLKYGASLGESLMDDSLMKESSMEEMVVETVEMTAPLAEESLVTGLPSISKACGSPVLSEEITSLSKLDESRRRRESLMASSGLFRCDCFLIILSTASYQVRAQLPAGEIANATMDSEAY